MNLKSCVNKLGSTFFYLFSQQGVQWFNENENSTSEVIIDLKNLD